MKLKLHIILILLTITFGASAQTDRYWSGGSSLSDDFSEAYNWFGIVSPNSGDNLYFNNTTGIRHYVYSNYGLGSYFNFFVTYNGAGGIKLYGANTYAKKFENYNDGNLLELSPNSASSGSREIGNRIDNDLEINPIGTGGVLVSCDKISMDNSNGTKNLKVYGTNTLTINSIIYEKNGSGSTLQLLNSATVDLKGNSIFTGITTVNGGVLKLNALGGALKSGNAVIINGGTLRIMQSQTLGALALNGGTLQVDAGANLTITGTYSSTGGTIDNKGTIKFAGGSVTFPGLATINNGVANTLSSLEVASSGTVTLNSILNVTGTIAVSSGTLVLGGCNLHLNGATLNIASGATFDNGGENQIINGGSGIIVISGTIVTRDAQGFVGTNTAIPSITPTLNPGSTVEYGLNGDQAVQGSTAPTYINITFSGSGTKTLASTNDVNGTIRTKDTAVFDASNHSFGVSSTKLIMTGTSEFKTAGTGVKPDMGGTYTLGTGTKITFTNTAGTLESIRLSPKYYNIDISGSSVGTNTSTGAIDFQSGGTFTVKSTGTFKLSNTAGFSGGTQTAISNVNNPTIILNSGSTLEYAGATQTITEFSSAYSNLNISGTEIKTTTATTINISNDLNITSAQLTIRDAQTFVVANKVNNSGGTFNIENNGSLVQVNDNAANTGNITYQRKSNSDRNTDYTYWSIPVSSVQTLSGLFPKTLAGMYYSYEVTATSEGWKQENFDTTMEIGKGYIVRGPEPNPTFPPSFPTASFTGIPNNGIQKISGIFQENYYLIGNPYPSAINANKFLAANCGVLDGTLYFWTHKTGIQDRNNIATIDPATGLTTAGSGALAYTSDDYASYNCLGGAAASGGIIPSGKIAAAQGFFASSNATIIGANEIIFNNSMRLDNTSNIMDNSQFFKTRNTKVKTAEAIEKHRVWLDLTNNQGAFKQTLIGYITDATNGYDSRFDGVSFDGNEFLDFYSINQNKNLVIQGRALPFDENDEVPLGYRTKIDGAFSINIDQTDGLLMNQDVFIEDKLTNMIFDLKSGKYAFTTEKGTFNDRFVLRYSNKTLKTSDLEILEKQILVSNKNKQIKVNSTVETIDKVIVYDLLGRQIFKKEKLNSNELSIQNLISTHQILLVKVRFQNGKEVTKKVVY